MPRLHVSTIPPRTKEQIAAQIRAQFRYARFSPQDYVRHWAFHRAIDLAPIITAKQFRELAKRRKCSEAFLVEPCKAELDCPTQTIRWYLTQCRAETIISHCCLTDLYVKATQPTVPTSTPKRSTHCACGCGVALRPKQRYASDACRMRMARRSQTPQKMA